MSDPAPAAATAAETTYGFWRWAARVPDRPAVIEADGETLSYRELERRVNQLSHALHRLGLRDGSRLVLAARNSATWLQVAFGAYQLGVSMVPVTWHMTANELAYVIADCAAEVVIVDDNAAGATEALDALGFPAERRLSIGVLAGFTPLDVLCDAEPADRPAPTHTAAAVLYTSGTSGRPKGVLRPAPPVLADGELPWGVHRDLEHGMHLGRGVNLTGAPLYHAAPGRAAIDALEMGLTVVVMARWDSERALELIERHRVSSFFMPPILLQRLADLPDEVRARHDVSSVQTITHTGAPCPPAVKRRLIDWFGPVIWEIYGGTESFATHCSSADWLARPGTVGHPAASRTEVRIVDEQTGAELGAGEVGIITIRSPMSLSFEYLGDPAKTAAAIDAEGFATIGDLGYLDGDGWLFISDRRSDLILSGGVNIYPAEIEGWMLEHPAVADIAVVGIPDAEYGQRILAVVALAAGAEPGPERAAELEAHGRRGLARFKVPRRWEFAAELPRSEAGKLLRSRVRAPYWPEAG